VVILKGIHDGHSKLSKQDKTTFCPHESVLIKRSIQFRDAESNTSLW